MAQSAYSISGATFVPGRGLRFVSRTGVFFQFGESDAGLAFRNDGGRAIPWFYETGWFGEGLRSKVAQCHAVVGNLLSDLTPAIDALAVRFYLYTDDQAAGGRAVQFDRSARQDHAATPVEDQWSLVPWNALPGVRHWFAVESRNSAQRIEDMDLTMEPIGGGGGD